MIWPSKEKREAKRKAVQERELKRSLSEKIAKYQKKQQEPVDDHTEIDINGKKIRVPKQQIDLSDTGN